jgi:hypothetical protein
MANGPSGHRFAPGDLEPIQQALTDFTRALYSAPATFDDGSLDSGVSSARQLARRLLRSEGWLGRLTSIARRPSREER